MDIDFLCVCGQSFAPNLNSFNSNVKSQEIQANKNSISFWANTVALWNS